MLNDVSGEANCKVHANYKHTDSLSWAVTLPRNDVSGEANCKVHAKL